MKFSVLYVRAYFNSDCQVCKLGYPCCCFFQLPDLPQEMWLLKTDDKPNISPALQIDMSRYFTNISDELDKWLFKGQEDSLTDALEQAISDNPWLMTSRSSSARSRSQSPAYSTASSTSLKPKKKSNINKWLLSSQSVQSTSSFSCPFMEKYMKDMNRLNWLKDEHSSFEPDFEGVSNPLSSFETQNSDLSKWLKPEVLETSFMQEDKNPLSSVLDRYNNMATDQWLLSNKADDLDTKFKVIDLDGSSGEEGKWLMPPSHLSPFVEREDFDCGDILWLRHYY